MRPVLLDLFCGCGGAAMGYHRAGFDVIGVDNQPQPRYPFLFFRMDWGEGLERLAQTVNVIHASPPCQFYSKTRTVNTLLHETVDLVEPVRTALRAIGKPFVIENVPGAPLQAPITLCGQMFGLRVLRHRLFESSVQLVQPDHGKHGDYLAFLHRQERQYADAMGVTWADKHAARQSIPPAYTEHIGRQLLERAA